MKKNTDEANKLAIDSYFQLMEIFDNDFRPIVSAICMFLTRGNKRGDRSRIRNNLKTHNLSAYVHFFEQLLDMPYQELLKFRDIENLDLSEQRGLLSSLDLVLDKGFLGARDLKRGLKELQGLQNQCDDGILYIQLLLKGNKTQLNLFKEDKKEALIKSISVEEYRKSLNK